MPSLRQKLKGAFSSKNRDINDYNSASQYSFASNQRRYGGITTSSYSQSSGAQQPASPFRPSYCYPSQPYYYSPSFAPQPVPHPFPTTAIQSQVYSTSDGQQRSPPPSSRRNGHDATQQKQYYPQHVPAPFALLHDRESDQRGDEHQGQQYIPTSTTYGPRSRSQSRNRRDLPSIIVLGSPDEDSDSSSILEYPPPRLNRCIMVVPASQVDLLPRESHLMASDFRGSTSSLLRTEQKERYDQADANSVSFEKLSISPPNQKTIQSAGRYRYRSPGSLDIDDGQSL